MNGVFGKVVVPVELEPAEPGQLALDRSVAVGDDDWMSIGEATVCALQLAARLAKGGDVYVVHATPDFRSYATWMPPARITELDAAASKTTTQALSAIVERLCSDVTLHYVIAPGKPLDVILAAAARHSTDAIVLAASTRRSVSRAFLGSTTDKVIRQAICPVLVVPAGAA